MAKMLKVVVGMVLLLSLFSSVLLGQVGKKQLLEQKIIQKLKTIKDPDLGVNVYDLGLVRDIIISPNNKVHIRIIFTKLFCPYGKKLVTSIRKEVGAIPAVKTCKVSVDIKTRWKRSMLTKEGKEKLKDVYSW